MRLLWRITAYTLPTLVALGLLALVAGVALGWYGSPLNQPGPRGDTDKDGVVSATDALHVLRYVAGLEMLGPTHRDLSDVDSDGQVDAVDALLILRQVAGIGTPAITYGGETSPASIANVEEVLAMLPPQVVRGAVSRDPLLIWFSSHGQAPSGWQPYGDLPMAFWSSHDNGVRLNLIVLPPGSTYTVVAHEIFHAYSGHWDTFSGRESYGEGDLMEDFATVGATCYGRPPGQPIPEGIERIDWFANRFGECR